MAEVNLKNCRFCGKPIKADLEVCPICGYNSKTDTRDPAFENSKKSPAHKKDAVMSGPKPKSDLMKLLKPIFIVFFLVMGYSAFVNYHIGDLIGEKFQEMTDPKAAAKAKKEKKTRYANAAVKKSTTVQDVIKKVIPQQTVEDKRKTTLMVEGIVYDPSGRSFATINGMVVSEGESVAGVKVVKINKESVEIDMNGAAKVLQVSESIPLPASAK